MCIVLIANSNYQARMQQAQLSEVHAEVGKESTMVCGIVLVVRYIVQAKLIAHLDIEQVVLCPATQLEAGIEAVEIVFPESAVLVGLAIDCHTEVGSEERQQCDFVAGLDAIFDEDGYFEDIEFGDRALLGGSGVDVISLTSPFGVIQSALQEDGGIVGKAKPQHAAQR